MDNNYFIFVYPDFNFSRSSVVNENKIVCKFYKNCDIVDAKANADVWDKLKMMNPKTHIFREMRKRKSMGSLL